MPKLISAPSVIGAADGRPSFAPETVRRDPDRGAPGADRDSHPQPRTYAAWTRSIC